MESLILRSVIILAIGSFCKGVGHERQKRYLVYEPGGPSRAQFIFGVGIPVETKQQSVTVGTVFKFQYDLPTNSSQYTSTIYSFVNTVSRHLDKDQSADDKINDIDVNENKIDDLRNSKSVEGSDAEEIAETTTEMIEDDDALVDITFDEDNKNDRKKRATTMYKKQTQDIIGKKNELTLAEAIAIQEKKDALYKKKTVSEEGTKFNRWHMYQVLEKMAERYGYTGRPCLLRSICEASEVPFTHATGLLGEIAHILFTPSSTRDKMLHHTDNEYHAAERIGRREVYSGNRRCEDFFPECEASILDTVTQVGLETFRKFGFDSSKF